MHIVDSQVHLWAAESASRPWPPGRAPEAQKPYQILKETLLFQMDLAGVSRMVLVPPSWEGDRNDMALEAARSYPDRFAVMGRLALQDPASRALVADWRKQPGMLGMRFTFHNEHYRHFLTDGTADWLWPEAEQLGVPIGLLCPGKTKAVGAIAAKHPRLRLLIDHMARPRHVQDEAAFADLPDLLALARYPNVAVKASGAPGYSSAPWPYRNIHPYLKQIFDAFGPSRMFWGTDITRMPCSWRQCVTMFTEEVPWLKGKDLELVMGRGLCDWIGWNITQR